MLIHSSTCQSHAWLLRHRWVIALVAAFCPCPPDSAYVALIMMTTDERDDSDDDQYNYHPATNDNLPVSNLGLRIVNYLTFTFFVLADGN